MSLLLIDDLINKLIKRVSNYCQPSFIIKFIHRKKVYVIIRINKDEKEAMVKKFPKMHIVRTMKQDSKRCHYYMVEEPKYVEALNKMRGIRKD